MKINRSVSCAKVAVILAAFNGVEFIFEQIQSILRQKGIDLHVFVNVDRSFDGTEEKISEWISTEPRLTLLPIDNRFCGAAKNFFHLIREVDFSMFDYISLADQDDIWLPGKLCRAVEQLICRGTDGYSSDVIAFWQSGHSRLIRKSYPQRRWDYLFESPGPGCSFVLSRRLSDELKSFLQQNVEAAGLIEFHDWFIYAFARAHGYQWTIDNCAGLLYRQHQSNYLGANLGLGAFAWRARRVLDGWGLEQSRLIADLVGLGANPIVRQWSRGNRSGLLWLAFQSWHCRRRPLDRLWFFVSCVTLAAFGLRS